MSGHPGVTADGGAAAGARFGVVGTPIAHSLSPVLHRTAYRQLGREDLRYEAHEVTEGSLEAFLSSGEGAHLAGVSVTMPLKREAWALGARAGGELDPVAARLGIANTLVRRAGGTWRAENFDVHGIIASLSGLSGGLGAGHGTNGGVIGSGATALSALAALLDLGVREVLLSARAEEKLAPLQDLARGVGADVRVVPWEKAERVCAADVVISALALEGAEDLAARWGSVGAPDTGRAGAASVPRPGVFLDVLYHPWPAPLAGLFEAWGVRVVSGLEMLVHQAGDQVASMLGVPIDRVPLAAMRAAAQAELARR